MQFALDLPPFGPFSNPHLVAGLAHEAEEAGWDGFFVWDHLNYHQAGLPQPVAIADPWMRTAATPFDVVASGSTGGQDPTQYRAQVAAFARAGATWWVEGFDPLERFEQVRQRIHQGAPRF